MEITFLGTGTSQGVPVIGCNCETCQSANAKDKRLRSSVHIKTDDISLVIDSGPDFRQQMLRENILRLDAILFTHQHKDHIAGLDDVRAYNYFQKKPMDVYGDFRVHEALKREFAYVFDTFKYPGIPEINLFEVENEAFQVKSTEILPIQAMHLRLPVFGYKIGNAAYITDANFIEKKEIEKIKNIDILILNALRKKKHISHFTLEEALELIAIVSPRKAYLTHVSHQMGLYEELKNELPGNVHFAYDGLKLEC